MPTTLLVGHDFSEHADRAVRRAIMLARDAGHIIVFHAVSDGEDLNAVRERLSSRLALMVTAEQHARFAVEVRSGPADQVAFSLLKERRGDLLLIGLHGKTGLSELLATNAMTRMTSAPTVPTLIVTRSPPQPYRRILVGVDFAETAASALALTCDWFPDAEVTAAHAFDIQLGRRATGPVTIDDLDESRRLWLEQAVIRARGSGGGPSIHTLLLHGTPAGVLAAAARDHGSDLIVLGRHNRGRLMEAFLGSVARKLLPAQPCDVLVVPPSRA